MEALRSCMANLPEQQRGLIEQRYASKLSIKALAEMTNRTANNMGIVIHRIRQGLRKCIQQRMGATA